MTDASDTIRKFTFIAFAIVLVVCVAASFQYRGEILGGFALRGAQTSFEERVQRAVGPEAVVEYRDQTERSAVLVVQVPSTTYHDPDERNGAADAVWVAYAEEFAAGGMPVEMIVLTPVLLADLKLADYYPVGDLAARTGVPAPPLHAMYAEKGYFDPSTEAGPAEAATDE